MRDSGSDLRIGFGTLVCGQMSDSDPLDQKVSLASAKPRFHRK